MPFITSEARRMTDKIGPSEVGDRCFVFYREMLRAWRGSPRWTTAHNLYKKMKDDVDAIAISPGLDGEARRDDMAACELAWQVFFQLHIVPFEMGKRTLNGEIDF